MNDTILSSPLEQNLNKLIRDQFSRRIAQFKQFLAFTDGTKQSIQKCSI